MLFRSIVEARQDTTVVIHPLTDHRRVLPLDKKGELVEAHDDFQLVISYNPGYQNFMKSMKPSTRQRFVALSFDFPEASREEAILRGETGCDEMTARRLVSIGRSLRHLKDVDLEEVPSTRLLVYAAVLIHNGMDPVIACRSALIESLSDDPEITTALMEVVLATFGR